MLYSLSENVNCPFYHPHLSYREEEFSFLSRTYDFVPYISTGWMTVQYILIFSLWL